MRKLVLALAFILASALNAQAQSTTVSGTVTDAGSQAWAGGKCQFNFVPNPQFPTGPYTWTGGTLSQVIPCPTMNGAGAYSVSVPSNTSISPQGSNWILQVTPDATSPSFSTPPTTITGGTQTLNVTPPAIAIAWSLPPGPAISAYSDAEIVGTLPKGAEYFNVTSGFTRVWNGTSWSNLAPDTAGSIPATSFGVKADTRTVVDASVTSGLPTVTSATITFTPADVGKFVFTVRAGGTVDLKGNVVSVQSATQATASANAGSTQTGETIVVGTDDTLALEAANAAALNQNKALALPCGQMLIEDTPFSYVDFAQFVPSTSTNVPVNQTFYVYGPDANCTFLGMGPNFNFSSSRNLNGVLIYGGNCAGCAILEPGVSAPGWGIEGMAASGITITAYGQAFAGINGKTLMQWSAGFGRFNNIQIQRVNGTSGFFNGISTNSENILSQFNCQNNLWMACVNSTARFWKWDHSVCAFNMACLFQANGQADLTDVYWTQNPTTGEIADVPVSNIVNSSVRIIGGWYDTLGGAAPNSTIDIDGTSVVDFSAETSCSFFNVASGGVLRFHGVRMTEIGGGCATVPWLTNAGTFYNDGGNAFVAPGTAPITSTGTYVVSPDGLQGACTGVVTASATLGLYGIPGVTGATTCTNTTIGGAVSKGGKTLMHLFCSASAVGVATDACTVVVNGSASIITCSLAAVTSCSDVAHTVAVNPGDIYAIEIVTHGADTLANVKAQVDVN